MEKLAVLQNIFYILNKKPAFTFTIEIDGISKSITGDNINIIEPVVNFFLDKYNTIEFSISPVNTLLELCSKNKIETPIYISKCVDDIFYTSCMVENFRVIGQHSKKKESKNRASIEMIKILYNNNKLQNLLN